MTRHLSRFLPLLALAAIFLALSPVWAQKGKPMPQPDFPVFDLTFVPGLFGNPRHINDEGDMALSDNYVDGRYGDPVAYLHERGIILKRDDLVDPAVLLKWEFLEITAARLTTESDGSKTARYAIKAQYKGTDPYYIGADPVADSRTAGTDLWVCRLDCTNVGEDSQTSAFLAILPFWPNWTPGATTGGGRTKVLGMNDLGVVCGVHGAKDAFIMWPNSTEPEFLFPRDTGEVSDAYAINNWMQVVGGKNGRAFRLTPWYISNSNEDELLTLNGLVEGDFPYLSRAEVINDSGHFAGNALGKVTTTTTKGKNSTTTTVREYYAFHYVDEDRYVDGQLIDGGMEGLFMREYVYTDDINSNGDIVGNYSGAGKYIYLHDQYILLDLVVGFSIFGSTADERTFNNDNCSIKAVNRHRHIAGNTYANDGQITGTFLLKPRP